MSTMTTASRFLIEEVRYGTTPEARRTFDQAYSVLAEIGPGYVETPTFIWGRVQARDTSPERRTPHQRELMPANYNFRWFVGREGHSGTVRQTAYGSLIVVAYGEKLVRTAFMGYLARENGYGDFDSESVLVERLMKELDGDSRRLTRRSLDWRWIEIERGNPKDINLARMAMDMGAFPLNLGQGRFHPTIDIERGEKREQAPRLIDNYFGNFPIPLTPEQAREASYDLELIAAIKAGIDFKEYIPHDPEAHWEFSNALRSLTEVRHDFSEAAVGWLSK